MRGPAPAATPELVGDGIRLGPWRPTDVAAVLELADDPSTRAWSASMRPVRTEDDARAWMAARGGQRDRVDWAVHDATTGALVGRIGLLRFDLQSGSAELGYGVHPAHRRRGVARRAVAAATAYGFRTLGLNRIALVHATANVASCGVAIASGFAFEGVERAALDHGDGVLHDAHRHARLATDPTSGTPSAGRVPTTVPAAGLSLRPWRLDDAEAVLAAFADPLIARWNPRKPLPDLDAATRWLVARMTGWASGDACWWAVTDTASGDLLGSTGLRHIDPVDHGAVASYWTVSAARGRGVAPAALTAATDWAFAELGLHRVQLAHVLANEASCRVAEKAGFRLEATIRGSCLLREGFADEHLHARLPTDPVPA